MLKKKGAGFVSEPLEGRQLCFCLMFKKVMTEFQASPNEFQASKHERNLFWLGQDAADSKRIFRENFFWGWPDRPNHTSAEKQE